LVSERFGDGYLGVMRVRGGRKNDWEDYGGWYIPMWFFVFLKKAKILKPCWQSSGIGLCACNSISLWLQLVWAFVFFITLMGQ